MNALYTQNRTLIYLLTKHLLSYTMITLVFRIRLWLSFRPISKCQLNVLLRLHLTPIYHVVFMGSIGYLILRGASRLDAFSVYPCRTWLLCHRIDS